MTILSDPVFILSPITKREPALSLGFHFEASEQSDACRDDGILLRFGGYGRRIVALLWPIPAELRMIAALDEVPGRR